MKTYLPPSLLSVLLLALPTFSYGSPSPMLVSEDLIHLMPHHTLFLRQVSDLQTFSGNLGGVSASPITNSGDSKRPFSVDGDTFTDFKSASQRSCDNQFTGCSQGANQKGNKGSVTVNDCDKQKQECQSAQSSAKVQDFNTAVQSQNIGPDPQFPDFDIICEV
ncbi:uncharacterized protein BDR25DRAFT_317235 [Lindgomyces ingoldianus]|uniref:Uncharacterized protein n=1 Tax=Lindgomyces ingoldianus TaxID=673940 RepID=A0ACB6QJE4_9PLEO|nr:uncharacterized protein BDR25DRAFT_317235 [Lindgomyces ingoldianus]KAF2467006.1 hypothetical protein BDR25DRAFT_317235 [Lindgomyces ingoldianus]